MEFPSSFSALLELLFIALYSIVDDDPDLLKTITSRAYERRTPVYRVFFGPIFYLINEFLRPGYS